MEILIKLSKDELDIIRNAMRSYSDWLTDEIKKREQRPLVSTSTLKLMQETAVKVDKIQGELG